jgi:hypothetical protein
LVSSKQKQHRRYRVFVEYRYIAFFLLLSVDENILPIARVQQKRTCNEGKERQKKTRERERENKKKEKKR